MTWTHLRRFAATTALAIIPAVVVVSLSVVAVPVPQDDVEVDGNYKEEWADEINARRHRYPDGHHCHEYLDSAVSALGNHDQWYWGSIPPWAGGGFYNFTTGVIRLDINSFYSSADGGPLFGAEDRSHPHWALLFRVILHEGWHAAVNDETEGTGGFAAGRCGPKDPNA